MQYEVGKEYKMDNTPVICSQGFHYCKSMVDCYAFYPMTSDTRICEVEPLGEIVVDKDGIKFCTNHIKIIREIENLREMSSTDKSSSGYCNSGRYNSGDFNSGSFNSGYFNSGDCNSGIFNTATNPKIRIFDKESHWTLADWHSSKAAEVMCSYPNITTCFIRESDMSDEEKSNHPEYTTIGGYLKTTIITKEDKQKWWDNLPDEDKQAVYGLPNFDADKFEKCTGIKVNFDSKPDNRRIEIEKITEIKFL